MEHRASHRREPTNRPVDQDVLMVERLDALFGETDDRDRMPACSKVAVAAVVGNDVGADRSAADLIGRATVCPLVDLTCSRG
jgi:hypothetical protein